jgi:hypothetical protein
MSITRYHVDNAISCHDLRRKPSDRLAEIRSHFAGLPSTEILANRNAVEAIIAACDEILCERAA